MQTSSLSNLFIGVVDRTIHPIRTPSVNQHLYYSRQYEVHGILTHLLVDFDGLVVASLGRTNDSLVQTYNTLFHTLLAAKKRFVFGANFFFNFFSINFICLIILHFILINSAI